MLWFLPWLTQACLAGSRCIHPPERVAQEVEFIFRYLADSCLLFVHRELQLANDAAQVVQRRFGIALPAQDHELVRKPPSVQNQKGDILTVRYQLTKSLLRLYPVSLKLLQYPGGS
jgi:hypothetical protein